MRTAVQRRSGGFTLVEAVLVIVLVGILSATVAVFIRMPVQGYADTVARAEVSNEADIALRRMARELRLALPNSIRVNGDGSAIEFLLSKTGGRYLAAEDGVSGFNDLDFLDPTDTAVTVVGALGQQVDVGDYFVVYNLGSGFAPSDAWQFSSSNRNIARITTAVAAGTESATLRLADNPFATQNPPMPSPGQRFQIVSGPVTFACARAADGNLTLTRWWNYPIAASQAAVAPASGQQATMARRLGACAGLFFYSSADTQHSALVNISLGLQPKNATQTPVRLVHQVHVDNTP